MTHPVTPPENELSMEEILASIRKIISDEAPTPSAETHSKDETPSSPTAAPSQEEDVLELTQIVDEAGNPVEAQSRQKPDEPAEKAPVTITGEHKISSPPLISSKIFHEAAAALGTLNQAITRTSQAPEPQMSGVYSQKTTEALVKEILKPLLKEWLDANLPSLVKWIVTEQVEKIVQQATGYKSENNQQS